MSRPTPLFLLLALLFGACGAESEPEPETHAESDAHAEGEGEHGEHASNSFELTPEQEAIAVPSLATAGPALVHEVLEVSAVAGPNLDEQAHVNAPLPGIVTRIFSELGGEVEAGELMCELRSRDLADALASLRTARARLAATERMREREMEVLERGVAVAADALAREQELADSGLSTVQRLADRRLALQEAELARDQRLLALDKRLVEEELAVEAARADLVALGFADDGEVERLLDDGDALRGIYRLFASAPGVVMQRHITEGEFVDAQTQLFLVQGMEKIWVMGSVFEDDLRFVDEGQKAWVRFRAYPDVEFPAVVDHIHHDLEEATRSVRVRVQLENRPIAGRSEPHPLLPGMFATLLLEVDAVDAAVSVPNPAVLRDREGRPFVLVREGEGHWERRFVELGVQGRERTEILSGLAAGEEVAVDGQFPLLSLLRLEEIGEHGH